MYNLSKDDIEILRCWLDAWDDSDHKLPGRLSYSKVFDLINRLGLPRPDNLSSFCENPEKYFKEKQEENLKALMEFLSKTKD